MKLNTVKQVKKPLYAAAFSAMIAATLTGCSDGLALCGEIAIKTEPAETSAVVYEGVASCPDDFDSDDAACETCAETTQKGEETWN